MLIYPVDKVDLNGKFPWILIPLVIVGLTLTGCDNKEDEESINATFEIEPGASWGSDANIEEPNVDIVPQSTDSVKYLDLSEEEKLLVATVCGEAIGEGELGWKAVTNVIMNRVDSKYFSDSVTEVIQNTGFDAYTYQTSEYRKAMDYLENRTNDNELYEEIISVTIAIYRGDDVNDITQGSTLYYSPQSMEDPNSMPLWNFDLLVEQYVEGIDSNAIRFFKYKDECIE